MNSLNLRIDFIDGSSEECVAIAADLIAFESKFDMSVVRLETDLRLTHLFYIAWHVAKRSKKTEDEFEAWTEKVAGVSIVQLKK